jgi:hypothetical protein
MSRLAISLELLNQLRQSLFKDENESCAILYGHAVLRDGDLKRLVVEQVVELDETCYERRTPVSVQIRSEYIAQVSQRVKRSGESAVFVHNHPFSFNQFSKVDDDGERVLADFFHQRTPDSIHASLLLTPDAAIARILGENRFLDIIVAGPEINCFYAHTLPSTTVQFDRQVRVFGRSAQGILEKLRVAIVGLGGTGSIVAQQLSYLGVKDYLLIDPDTLEESNLNRVVGSTRTDVGQAKVLISQRAIRFVNPAARIETIQDSVLKNDIAATLVDSDFIFCCTDSHGSRAVLNQLSYQYLIPTIDMGMVISKSGSTVEQIAAKTQLLVPGLACLICGNLLDYEQVRRDLLSDFERKIDPYIPNHVEPAPAVISLNSTISSLAVTMFLNCVVGIPGNARFLNYNAITGTTRPVVFSQHPGCIVCSKNGSMAKGDTWQLPGRQL